MEAANIGAGGAREADVAPAPATAESKGAGWTPADPGPLGLAAFAATTFALSMVNSQLVSVGSEVIAVTLALAYGGIAQMIAGIWEFRTGNTFGAVAFTSYGAFWLSYFFLVHGVAGPIALAHAHSTVGLFLWTWTIFTVLMLIASLRTSAAVAFVFFLLTITFVLLAIGNSSLQGGTALTNNTIKLGGYFGIATAICAWYASFAAVINSTFGRVIAPVFPLHRP
jgi:succinate-acetate transporter protein